MALLPNDLLRDPVYRRLWSSVLIASIGAQVTLLALPLTAALLLSATPTQMGLLTAMESLPFALLSLPAGVWLDRVRKLPVYVAGEVLVALAVASVPLAWALGWLNMPWLYVVGFAIGAVNTTAGSAGQIVLTQVVPRERLVEAHARNALASSSAEVAGPGLAGALIRLAGAPLALLIDAALLLGSAWILRGLPVREPRPVPSRHGFWTDLRAGLGFVRSQRLLHRLAGAALDHLGRQRLGDHDVGAAIARPADVAEGLVSQRGDDGHTAVLRILLAPHEAKKIEAGIIDEQWIDDRQLERLVIEDALRIAHMLAGMDSAHAEAVQNLLDQIQRLRVAVEHQHAGALQVDPRR